MSDCTEITPQQARARFAHGALLIDVREPGEWALGSPIGALRIPLAQIGTELASDLADRQQPLIFICASGKRSAQACELATRGGHDNAMSVAGGFVRWRSEGLPYENVTTLSADARERYSRHLLLPQFGESGQQRLLAARVTIIGAGGLGSPAAFYLAAAGVGRLRMVDHDVVDRSNLQRQILHADQRIGESKVASAAQTLNALNPTVSVEALAEKLTIENVERIIADADVVIDGSDNFPTRYLLNDACVKLGKPLIYGAVHRFDGQVSVFHPAHAGGSAPCYRCYFPEPPAPEDAPNCAEAGVLGVVPGVIGLLQANEAIKLIAQIGAPLLGRILCFDALNGGFREIRLPRDPACSACGVDAGELRLRDYAKVCAAR